MGWADALAEVKTYKSSIHCGVFHLQAAHLPGRRTLAEPPLKILQTVRRPSGVDFYASVRQIADPARQPQFSRNTDGKVAVTHALDLSRYPEFARRHKPDDAYYFSS